MVFKDNINEVELPKLLEKQLESATNLYKKKLTAKSSMRTIVRVLCDGMKFVKVGDASYRGCYDARVNTIFYKKGGRITLFHEICHYLQQKAGYDMGTIGKSKLSDMLLLEQYCQAMAIKLINKIYPKMRIPKDEYSCYCDMECVHYLNQFYIETESCIENDFTNINEATKVSELKIKTT